MKLTTDADTGHIPTPVIQATFDYKMFKILPENRKINKGHLSRIKQSIKTEDMTAIAPILVNEHMQIIDGQNRFYACRELEKPIYYIQHEGLTGENIIRLNSYSCNWNMSDYLEYYVLKGYKDYQIIKEFLEKYKLTVSVTICMLSMTFVRWGDFYYKFKEGRFIATHRGEAETMAEELMVLGSNLTDSKINLDRSFLNAYMTLRNMVEFDVFKDVLQKYNLKIEREISKKMYLIQFERLLNWKKGKKLTRLI